MPYHREDLEHAAVGKRPGASGMPIFSRYFDTIIEKMAERRTRHGDDQEEQDVRMTSRRGASEQRASLFARDARTASPNSSPKSFLDFGRFALVLQGIGGCDTRFPDPQF